jgi:hypothetical protein
VRVASNQCHSPPRVISRPFFCACLKGIPPFAASEGAIGSFQLGRTKVLSVQRELASAAIGTLLDAYAPAECANYLGNSGYIKPNPITL